MCSGRPRRSVAGICGARMMRSWGGLRILVDLVLGTELSTGRQPKGSVGEVGDTRAVEPADGAAGEVVERPGPVRWQSLRAGDDPGDAAGGGAVGVGVPAALDGEPDRGGEVAVEPFGWRPVD